MRKSVDLEFRLIQLNLETQNILNHLIKHIDVLVQQVSFQIFPLRIFLLASSTSLQLNISK